MANGRDTSWHAEAQRLSEGGLGCPQIAERLGRSYSGVYKALHPERAKAYWDTSNHDPERQVGKLEWEKTEKGRAVRRGVRKRNRGACVDCGELYYAPKWADTVRCLSCEKARRRVEHERLLDRICELYRAGKTYEQIAAEMGWKYGGTAGIYVIELRERGRVTPRR